MEPAAGKVETIYIIKTKVKSVECIFRDVYQGIGIGKDAVYVKENLGWFLWLEGSQERLFLDRDSKPELSPGEEVEIVIRRKTPNAKLV